MTPAPRRFSTDPKVNLVRVAEDPWVALYPAREELSKYEGAVCDIVEEFGVANILDLYANGETQSSIARALKISSPGLWRYYNRYGMGTMASEIQKVNKRAALWAEAKVGRAEIMAESILDIADEAPETTEGVAKAKLRVDVRKWRAATLDPKQFGQQTGPSVHVNIGNAFLESLRKHGTSEVLPNRQVPDAEFTVEE